MNRASRHVVLTAVAALSFPGCGDHGGPMTTATTSVVAEAPVPLVPRVIAPQTTDPAIDWIPLINPQLNHHYVWLDPSRTPIGKLFVLLPGTGAPTRAMQRLQQEAARLGYHVIGLMYQNSVNVPATCAGNADPECSGSIRLEIIDGLDRSGLVSVTPANGIDNRLTKLLLYLDTQYPVEGWSEFLKDGAPKWSQIAVGGHSDGGGEAALIATLRHVYRVLMLSGPSDARVPGETDPWLAIGETPAAKYYGLYHQREIGAASLLANLRAFDLGRFGEPVAAELGEPPFDWTRILFTDLEPQDGYTDAFTHRSTALDRWTPLAPDGTPRLHDAWRYMLGAFEDDGGL